jgi:hypothetical protein
MKNEIQRQICDETKNMSVEELLRYFNKGKSIEKPVTETPATEAGYAQVSTAF